MIRTWRNGRVLATAAIFYCASLLYFFGPGFDQIDKIPRLILERCHYWSRWRAYAHYTCDLVIWAAYFGIPAQLVYFLLKRAELPVSWIFVLFGAFIIGCGHTHYFAAATVVNPTLIDWWTGAEIFTAVVSTITLFATPYAIRLALNFKGPSEISGLYDALETAYKFNRLTTDVVRDYAIITLDSIGNVATWNAGAERILGYTPEEIMGRHFSVFYPPISANNCADALLIAMEEGEYAYEGWRVRKDNTKFWGDVVISAVRDDDGRLLGFSKITRDRTPQHDMQEALAAANRRFQAGADAAPAGFIMVNSEGVIESWNPAAVRDFGWAPEEAIGSTIEIVLPPTMRDRGSPVRAMLSGKGAQGGTAAGYEFTGVHKSGRPMPIEMFIQSYTFNGTVSFIVILRDITPRKIAEEERTALLTDLKRSNDELNQFAYVASHDLQEPLRTMSTYTKRLVAKLEPFITDDVTRKYADYIVESDERARTMVNDLLAYSRVTTRAKPFERIDVCELMLEVQGNLREQLDREEATVDVQPCTKPIYGDLVQLRQVFQNLISNAIKFHAKGVKPEVSVRWDDGGAAWHFRITDNGIGISREDIPKLFFMFTRLHARGEYEGTGIGLTLCKKIIERHGGTIWIESTTGKGSTFHFTIPKEGKTDVR